MNNIKSLFVTATGTDIGKTYVSALIIKKMRELGYNCGYYKPVLSGAIKKPDGIFLPGDCDYVSKISGLNRSPIEMLTYCFEEAVSPHLAAQRLGVKISMDRILKDFNRMSGEYDYILVEGAGGITCPLNLEEEKLLLSDVIKNLGCDILIVADGGLGTINSVLLTVEYAKSRGIGIKGIILNNYNPDNFMHNDNFIQIERLTGIKVCAIVKKHDKRLVISEESLIALFGEI